MGRETNTVAERLRRTRLALGYGRGKKTAFANRIGVDKGDYTKFEQGERALPLSAGIRIKEEFGISLDWLFCGDKAHLSTDLYDKIIQIRQAA